MAHIAADNSGVTDAAHPQKSQHFESWGKFKCVQKLILVTLRERIIANNANRGQREIALYGKRPSSEQCGHGTATAL